jgi:hypothetical protein
VAGIAAVRPTVVVMSRKDDVREFLISRRALVTPEQAGIEVTGEDRRVPGLRREEVAMLAGVSPDYYTRLERGNLRGASDSVLDAVARALRLSDVEREHLFDLARPAPARRKTAARPTAPTSVRPSVQRVLDSMTAPAIVVNAQQDIVATNTIGRALFAPHLDSERPNVARFIFLDDRARDFYVDWPLACSLTAAMLRFEAGRDPLNDGLTALVGELATRSPQFRKDWAQRDVHEHRTGEKTYRHPEVGELDLAYDVFDLPGEPGLSMCTFTAVEASVTADRLAILGAWAAPPVGQTGAGSDVVREELA